MELRIHSGEVYLSDLQNIRPRRLAGPVAQSAVNFSEGRRPKVIREILLAIASESGAALADWSADFDHNRMVATLLGDTASVSRAILSACEAAIEQIDLREHSGVHPRTGAVDVIPLAPIRGVTMEQCVEASNQLGAEISRRFDIPVYLYERSARPDRRRSLPDIRKGGFEGLSVDPLTAERSPDHGPPAPHPTAGVTIVGAREPLIAYNVNLSSDDLAAARGIAARIRRERADNPRLAGVRALGLGLPQRGLVQVSMNLTIPDMTPVPAVFKYVTACASELGIGVLESEVIGLIPRSALAGEKPERILWTDYRRRQILENWF